MREDGGGARARRGRIRSTWDLVDLVGRAGGGPDLRRAWARPPFSVCLHLLRLSRYCYSSCYHLPRLSAPLQFLLFSCSSRSARSAEPASPAHSGCNALPILPRTVSEAHVSCLEGHFSRSDGQTCLATAEREREQIRRHRRARSGSHSSSTSSTETADSDLPFSFHSAESNLWSKQLSTSSSEHREDHS